MGFEVGVVFLRHVVGHPGGIDAAHPCAAPLARSACGRDSRCSNVAGTDNVAHALALFAVLNPSFDYLNPV